MERALVVQKVANDLFATEAAIDEALARASKLIAEIVSARQELGLAACVVDETVASATQAVSALSGARASIVASHSQLEEIRQRIGLRVKAVGFKLPPKSALGSVNMAADLTRQAG